MVTFLFETTVNFDSVTLQHGSTWLFPYGQISFGEAKLCNRYLTDYWCPAMKTCKALHGTHSPLPTFRHTVSVSCICRSRGSCRSCFSPCHGSCTSRCWFPAPAFSCAFWSTVGTFGATSASTWMTSPCGWRILYWNSLRKKRHRGHNYLCLTSIPFSKEHN